MSKAPEGIYYGKAPTGEHIVVLDTPNGSGGRILCLRPTPVVDPLGILEWLGRSETPVDEPTKPA